MDFGKIRYFAIAVVLLYTVAPFTGMELRGSTSSLSAPKHNDSQIVNNIPTAAERQQKPDRLPTETEKTQTTQNTRTVRTYEAASIETRPLTTNQIPPGTTVRASLSSGASNGVVKAILREPVKIDNDIILPNGTVLVGTGATQENRLHVSFTQAVLQDGSVVAIRAQALDGGDKITGIKGSRVSNEARKLGSSIGLGFAARLAQGLKKDPRRIMGGDSGGQLDSRFTLPDGTSYNRYLPGNAEDTNDSPTLGDALAESTADAFIERSQQALEDIKDDVPIIEVKAGKKIIVLFLGSERS